MLLVAVSVPDRVGIFSCPESREYWMIYRRPQALLMSYNLAPRSPPAPFPVSKLSLFLSRSSKNHQIMRRRESLYLPIVYTHSILCLNLSRNDAWRVWHFSWMIQQTSQLTHENLASPHLAKTTVCSADPPPRSDIDGSSNIIFSALESGNHVHMYIYCVWRTRWEEKSHMRQVRLSVSNHELISWNISEHLDRIPSHPL